MTMAAWIRHEIRSHPKYKFDSAISEEILYDFACKADKVANGGIDCPELLGSPISKSSCFLPDKCKKMQAEVDAYKVTLTPR